MKTIKQIADELGVDKQKVYRYIKKNYIKEVNRECISETHQRNNVKYYDEVAESLIKQGISGDIESNEIHQEAHQEHVNDTMIDALLKQIEILQKELDVKNEQIRDTLKALDQAQQLQAMAENKVKLLEEKQEEEKVVEPEQEEQPAKRWWQVWR